MSGTILLFGFDSLLNILALSAAVAPFDAEVVPVARGDYNKPMGVLAGLDTEAAPSMPYAGGTLGNAELFYMRYAVSGSSMCMGTVTGRIAAQSAMEYYGA